MGTGNITISFKIDTEHEDARSRIFKPKQPIDPSYIGKNLITHKEISEDADPPKQNERLQEYLIEFRKDLNIKKIISELFENKAITFSLNKSIVLDNVDTEVHARDFIHNLRRKMGALIGSIP